MSQRLKIEVWITKTFKWRARISQPGQVSYEVTVGGQQWSLGKGTEFKDIIKKKIEHIIPRICQVSI